MCAYEQAVTHPNYFSNYFSFINIIFVSVTEKTTTPNPSPNPNPNPTSFALCCQKYFEK